MNQNAALKTFITDNFAELTDTKLSQQRLRALEREFFVSKHTNRFKRPSMKDIVLGLYSLMVRRGLSVNVIGGYLDELPIFRFAGESLQNDLLEELTRPGAETALAEYDLEVIGQVGAFEAVKQAIGDEVREEKRKELGDIQAQIEQKQEELASLPSILDHEEVTEPPFDPAVEDIRPWWERFYLKGNPFPRKDGLSDISEDLYENVLVKTKPFQATLSALNRNSAFLFDTAFLLAGDYGYGKTTFIDYLSYYMLANYNILSIRITCGRPHPDSMGFLNDFYLKLRNALRHENDLVSDRLPTELADMGIEDQVVELALRLTQTRRSGIVVFLDDYHKHRSYFQHIYEFLGLLQIIKDSLARSSAKVGFVVSGTAEWKDELLANAQMAGFFDSSPIEMPEITPELVCEVFNQRIKAYCFDKSPRTIKLDFVRRIFMQIEGKSGFRDYLTRITTELTDNNLSIIDTPVDIPEETLATIRADIERDRALLSSLNKLNLASRFKNYSVEQIAKCYELLIHTHIHNGVGEGDPLFLENKYYFLQLRDSTLIQKRRSKGAVGLSAFQWVLHSRLQKAVDDIQDRYGYAPSDYLLKIYGWKSSSAPIVRTIAASSGIPSDTKRYLNSDLGLDKAIREHIELAFRLFDELIAGDTSRSTIRQTVDRGKTALSHLSKAFFEIDKSQRYYRQAGISDLASQWQLHWVGDDSIAEAFSRISDFEAKPDDYEVAVLALQQVQDVFITLTERLRAVVEDVVSGKSHGLLTRSIDHTADEIDIFQLVLRDQYAPQGTTHFNYVRRITDYLEQRFRWFLLATTKLLFGDDYVEHIPEETRKYAYRSLDSRPNYSSIFNAYEGFTRSQFRNAFRNGGTIKDMVVDYLPIAWPSSDWDLFFGTFAEENIATAHLRTSTYDVSARPAYIRYCSMTEELTKAINDFLVAILAKNVFVASDAEHASRSEEFRVQFVYKPVKCKDASSLKQVYYGDMPPEVEAALQKAGSIEHSIATSTLRSVMSALHQKLDHDPLKCLVIDVTDMEYITSTYGVPWCDFVCSLALALHVEKSLAAFPWFGGSLLLKRGSPKTGERSVALLPPD